MDMFRWKDIQMRNKMWNMDLLYPVQDRAVGMLLHDTVTRKARVSWLLAGECWLWTVIQKCRFPGGQLIFLPPMKDAKYPNEWGFIYYYNFYWRPLRNYSARLRHN
jgi:hypothetical protein